MRVDLNRFGSEDLLRCTAQLRQVLDDAATTEAAARGLCRYFYDEVRGADDVRSCVLVRYYATGPYGLLPADLQRFAKRAYGTVAFTPPEPSLRCLVLLGTVGAEPEWNDRRSSKGHQAIPLPTPHVVERAPMVAQLIREVGLDLGRFAAPAGPLMRGRTEEGYGVFHVEDAVGSSYIPAQAGFVDRYGIRSVLGFGGALPSGELYATLMFARSHIPVDTADRFRAVALEVREGLSARERPTFDPSPGAA